MCAFVSPEPSPTRRLVPTVQVQINASWEGARGLNIQNVDGHVIKLSDFKYFFDSERYMEECIDLTMIICFFFRACLHDFRIEGVFGSSRSKDLLLY